MTNNNTPSIFSFFDVLRERLALLLHSTMSAGRADDMAVEAITRIEGATLWLAVMDDAGPMRRTVEALLVQAARMQQADRH